MTNTIYRIINFLVGCSLVLLSPQLQSQGNGFDFGKITYEELDMKTYSRDTSAVAVVLNEFGDASFDLENLNRIIFQYHVKIKILKEAGKSYADFEIPMSKRGTARQEIVRNVKASSFNREGNSWKETILLGKDIYTENSTEEYSITKFAVPDVRVGSVIEVYYQLETPFTYSFIPWRFQWDIPKVKSEFWAKYPAYYQYNITLKGFLNLTKNVAELVRQCVGSGGYSGGPSADCSLFKYAMENIPAFKEEEHMTAKKNFVSAITFELDRITQRDGQVDKITSEWKDAEQELKQHENFGVQIRKARNVFEDKAKALREKENDPLALCKSIYDYMRATISWNEEFGFLTDKGIKKTMETSKGNVADVNLSLLGALLEAGLDAEPVLISTRANGLPTQHHPSLNNFNYVVVRAKIADKYYWLDATSNLYPFGFIPERCLNGQGRALGETSAWIDIKPNDKRRTVNDIKMRLSDDGTMSGTASINYYGYAAYTMRNSYFGFSKKAEYGESRTSDWVGLEVKNFTSENEAELTKPFIEKIEFTLDNNTGNASTVYLQPFLFDRTEKNPFLSEERMYPVDFGAPPEYIFLVSFEYPLTFIPEELPKSVALALPQGGGRYLLSVTNLNGKITISSSLSLTKPVYNSVEYHALKEIYSRYISDLQMQIVLKKK